MKTESAYSKKLRDPRWQKKRLDILNRDNFACVLCEATTEELQVHHENYRRGADPWDYDDAELHTLCKSCHESTEELITGIRSQLMDSVSHDVYWKAARLFSCRKNMTTFRIINALYDSWLQENDYIVEIMESQNAKQT
jgi:hypothetical protein